MPGVAPRVEFVVSPLFAERNQTLDIVLSDLKSKDIIIARVLTSEQVVMIDPATLPTLKQASFFYIAIRLNGIRLAQSLKFVFQPNVDIATDPFSIAVAFSAESYHEISDQVMYNTAGLNFRTLFAYSVGDNAALLVASEETKLAVIAFRGTTQSFSDWANTLDITPLSCREYLFKGCGGGFLHGGFASSFNLTKSAIRLIVGELVAKGYNFIVTGHSKGGAIAQIQAGDLIQAFPGVVTQQNLRLITFGSPRVGDAKFAATLDALIPPSKSNSVRIYGASLICGADPVIGLPPKGFYQHAGAPVSVSCNEVCLSKKRFTQGLAIKCHFMNKYVGQIAAEGLGRPQ